VRLHVEAQLLRLVDVLGRHRQQGEKEFLLQGGAGRALLGLRQGLGGGAVLAGGVDRHPVGFQALGLGHHGRAHRGRHRRHPVHQPVEMVLHRVVRALAQGSHAIRRAGDQFGRSSTEVGAHEA